MLLSQLETATMTSLFFFACFPDVRSRSLSIAISMHILEVLTSGEVQEVIPEEEESGRESTHLARLVLPHSLSRPLIARA